MTPPSLSDLARVEAALKRHHAGMPQSYKATPLGLWTCSATGEIFDLLGQLDLDRYHHLVDLGSGDGRVVLLASLFLPATGLEADPELVAASQALAQELGLNQARFACVDCRRADLSPYDLLFVFPDKPLDWLIKMLPSPWEGRLLVHGPYFQPQGLGLVHQKTLYAGQTMCTLWRN